MSAERRESRGFEPPPWEKEQFDELERRVTEEGVNQELAEDATDFSTEDEGAEPRAEEPAASPADLDAVVPQVGTPGRGQTDGADDAIAQARMTELMAGLKAEEPPAEGFWKLGLAAAVFMAVLGSVMLIWGIVALQATRGSGQQLGWMGAAVLMTFGAGFIAVAGWLAYKNLQRQGVL